MLIFVQHLFGDKHPPMFVGKELGEREAQQAGTDKGAALKDVAWIVVQVILWRKKNKQEKNRVFCLRRKNIKSGKNKTKF